MNNSGLGKRSNPNALRAFPLWFRGSNPLPTKLNIYIINKLKNKMNGGLGKRSNPNASRAFPLWFRGSNPLPTKLNIEYLYFKFYFLFKMILITIKIQ